MAMKPGTCRELLNTNSDTTKHGFRLECEICLRNFSARAKSRQPFVGGKCGHSFCGFCTSKLNQDKKCPHCRAPFHPVKNFALIECLENMDKMKKQMRVEKRKMNERLVAAGLTVDEEDGESEEDGSGDERELEEKVSGNNVENHEVEPLFHPHRQPRQDRVPDRPAPINPVERDNPRRQDFVAGAPDELIRDELLRGLPRDLVPAPEDLLEFNRAELVAAALIPPPIFPPHPVFAEFPPMPLLYPHQPVFFPPMFHEYPVVPNWQQWIPEYRPVTVEMMLNGYRPPMNDQAPPPNHLPVHIPQPDHPAPQPNPLPGLPNLAHIHARVDRLFNVSPGRNRDRQHRQDN